MTAEQIAKLRELANKLAREGCTPNNAGEYVRAINWLLDIVELA